jgi:hypothetical protein
VHKEFDSSVRKDRSLNADRRAEKRHLLQSQQNELSAIRSQKALERQVRQRPSVAPEAKGAAAHRPPDRPREGLNELNMIGLSSFHGGKTSISL